VHIDAVCIIRRCIFEIGRESEHRREFTAGRLIPVRLVSLRP
jgi:hypothetical protein